MSIRRRRWRISWAIRLANASATFKWCGLVAIYVVNGRTGATSGVDYHKRRKHRVVINNDERTADYYQPGLPAKCSGDYLELSLPRLSTTRAALRWFPDLSAYFDGTTPITIFDGDATG